jgi:PBP1b-binding outer membrane lipoprotein LpoB
MKKIFAALLSITLLGGCVSMRDDVLGTQNSQVQTRNYQSRSFDTKDREMVLRSVVSTMQDLGFIIDRADETLGTVSGTSFTHSSKLTVSVRTAGQNQILVRANAQAGLNEIDDPIAYQNFFNSLSQSLFLDAHAIE